MSKAEDRALERFPVHEGASKEWIKMHLKGVCTEYIEGYHQAEKDTIEKAMKWLESNLKGVVGGSIYIEDFLKAMKDE